MHFLFEVVFFTEVLYIKEDLFANIYLYVWFYFPVERMIKYNNG
jgi:hypothetical protein